MKKSLTAADIEAGLRNLGVKRGDMLEVHSSLRSLGHVDGAAEAVIHALMSAVGDEGALVLPAFKISGGMVPSDDDKAMGINVKIKILGDDERNGMGIIPEVFRNMPGVLTGTGMKRVSAWGKDADKHVHGYQHLIDNGGKALMIGVDITSMSSMHYVEDNFPQRVKDMMAPTAGARAKYPEDEWIIKSWNIGTQPWYKIQDMAYERGYIADGMIGSSKCMLFKVKETIELYRDALINEPYELLGLI